MLAWSLSCGTVIEADLVVTAIAGKPAVLWVARCDMIADVSSDHPWYGRLAAACDAAPRMPHRYCTRLRVEHWDDARLGPTTAVAAILRETYATIPSPTSGQ